MDYVAIPRNNYGTTDMSTVKFDNWKQTASGVSVTTMVNFFTYSANPNQSTAPYTSSDYGYNNTYGSAPTASTSGQTLGQFWFTPKFGDSTLIIQTSAFTFKENSNVTDDFRLWIDDGVNTMIWRKMDSWYGNSPNSYNAGYISLHGKFPNQGVTPKKYNIRWDNSGATGSYFQVCGRYDTSYAIAPFYLTIAEYR